MSASSARWRMRVTQQASKSRARLADAVLAGGRDLAPEVDAVRQVGDLGAVAGLGRRRPGLDRAVDRDLLEPPEAARLAEGREAQQAEVVRPALHHRHVAGRGRAPARGAACPSATSCSCRFLVPVEITTRRPSSHRGQQVGERLAGAGAGLGQQQPAVARARRPRPPRAAAAPGAPRSRAAPGRALRPVRRSPQDESRDGHLRTYALPQRVRRGAATDARFKT